MGLTAFYCTHQDKTFILHVKIKTIFFQTKILKTNYEATLTGAAKLEVDTNVDHILGRKRTMTQNVLGPQRIDHREGIMSGKQAIALWSKG